VCVALYPFRAAGAWSKHIIANRLIRVGFQIDRFVCRQVVFCFPIKVSIEADDATPGGNNNIQLSS
jgi:hypothetical protein